MQSKAKPFDDIANLLTNAMGAAKGVGDEMKAAARAKADGVVADMDLVGREEFDVVKQMFARALDENDVLKAKVKKLESEVAKLKKAK